MHDYKITKHTESLMIKLLLAMAFTKLKLQVNHKQLAYSVQI